MLTVEVRYDAALLRTAVRLFFLRSVFTSVRMSVLPACALIGALIGYMVVGAMSLGMSAYGMTGAAIGAALFACLGVGLLVKRYADLDEYVHRLFRPDVTYALGLVCDRSSDFAFRVCVDGDRLPLADVDGVWRFARFWLLRVPRYAFVIVPLEGIDATALSFIADSARTSARRVGELHDDAPYPAKDHS